MDNGESAGSGAKFASLHSMSAVQNALEHLASIDPIEVCKEAKLELCRSTRDLRSCSRYVQHVLNSCGHASLCAECRQRCNVCPICRTPIPKSGNLFRPRLYDQCMEVGLISMKYDDQFQEKGGKHSTIDVQRLYSLFDVAVENNLVTLICHYITDLCMDESAVSSDPVMAILLDEFVVTEWCKMTFRRTLGDLHSIYKVGVKEMARKTALLLKSMLLLTGVTNVLEILEASFQGTQSVQLDDLHHLSENVLRAKQAKLATRLAACIISASINFLSFCPAEGARIRYLGLAILLMAQSNPTMLLDSLFGNNGISKHLELMVWCLRNQFLEHMPSHYPTISSWRSVVNDRKSAAIQRSWPEFMSNSTEAAQPGSTLFIEDALSNLGIDQEYEGSGELEVSCLQKDSRSSLPFRSIIEGTSGIYPFENLRAAIDILFLRGSSDLVVAKQAILLYYLFDRHWTIPDGDWRKVVDDYANTFGIGRHSIVESLAFYLLDDHTEAALKEACRLLPEIAGPGTHPKVAQVLLERQMPDAALMVLRCSGHDGLSPSTNSLHEETQLVPLRVAVTAVRVRIECGLLTQAFMYQRVHCLRLKEEQLQHKSASMPVKNLENGYCGWKDQMDILVTEICFLCIRRNLVDRMIELPWNVDEEKCLCKCLLGNAVEDLSSTSGSLLIVYHLQRYRYVEAYQVDQTLKNLEDSIISKNIDDERVSRIRSISQWRTGLVAKCVDLLPEVQRQQLQSGSITDVSSRTDRDAGFSGLFDVWQPTSKISPISSTILPLDVTNFSSWKATVSDTHVRSPDTSRDVLLDFSGRQASSALHKQSPASGHQIFLDRIGSPALDKASEPRFKCNLDVSLSGRKTRAIDGTPERYNLSYDFNPLKGSNRGILKSPFISSEDPSHRVAKLSYAVDYNDLGNRHENSDPSLLNGTTLETCYWSPESELQGSDNLTGLPSWYTTNKDKARFTGSFISGKRLFHGEAVDSYKDHCTSVHDAGTLNVDRAPRWRSDEASEDEEDATPARNMLGLPSTTPAREKEEEEITEAEQYKRAAASSYLSMAHRPFL